MLARQQAVICAGCTGARALDRDGAPDKGGCGGHPHRNGIFTLATIPRMQWLMTVLAGDDELHSCDNDLLQS